MNKDKRFLYIIYIMAAAAVAFLTGGCSKQAQSGVLGVSEPERPTVVLSEEESRDEALYVRAVDEENALHYTYAKELFSQIMDYKDAGARYDNLMKILLPYNGTYRIHSNGGNSYTIVVNDGVGSMSWDSLSGSVHTMNLYGMYFRDVSDNVSMVFDVNLGKEDWNYSATQDRYILELDEEDNVKILGVDGNRNHDWDGFGVKTE